MTEILLANPRSFCAGVARAVAIVEEALTTFGAPIYVRHQIIHNPYVVDSLRRRGVVFVKEVDEIPEGAITIFSAHGVSKAVRKTAGLREHQVIDATCPLVSKVHNEVVRYRNEGREVILVGHRGHPEVEGTMGQDPDGIQLVENEDDVASLKVADPGRVACVTQTTLSVDDTRSIVDLLRKRFPSIRGSETKDICYATRNRQQAVRKLAEEADVIIVLGGALSSNSARLREVGEQSGRPSHHIEDSDGIDPEWFRSASTIGLTSGASTPDVMIKHAIDRIREILDQEIPVRTLDGPEENVTFKMPEISSSSVAAPTV